VASSMALSPAALLTHSLPGSSAVRCVSVLQNAVICACNDGSVHRISFMVIPCFLYFFEFLLRIRLFGWISV